MAEKQDQTPTGDEETLTPQGTEGEPETPKTAPIGENLPPEGEQPEMVVDYKIKFGESTRENQRISEENAKLLRENEELRIKSAKAETTLSEEELSTKYPDWEFLADDQKGFIKRQESLEKDIREMKEAKAWNENYTNTLTQFPQLKGKEAEFKEFCYSEENIGNKNLVLLAKAFIFDKGEPAEPEKTMRKGLETPSGGTKIAPTTGWSIEDVKRLRETDPKRYLKMIQRGELKPKYMK